MNDRLPDVDPRIAVIVPARPGPVIRLRDLERSRDDIDDLLDDVFGAPDDRGPGAIDAVLMVAGLAAIIGGIAGPLPRFAVACGIASLALGAVLPVRSAWRRAAAARRTRRIRSMAGDGMVLRGDHPQVEQLLTVHERLRALGTSLAPEPRDRVAHVSHAVLVEVASLLGGRAPASPAELAYVAARVDALEQLAATVADPRVADGESARRQALIEARHEIEQLTGTSSLTEASNLARELLGTDDA